MCQLFLPLSPLVLYSIAHLLSVTTKKGAHCAGWFFQEKKFTSILIKGQEKASGKLYYGKPCLVYMQCSYAMRANADCQCATAVADIQSVLTVLRAHRVCVLWNSSYKINHQQWLPLQKRACTCRLVVVVCCISLLIILCTELHCISMQWTLLSIHTHVYCSQLCRPQVLACHKR